MAQPPTVRGDGAPRRGHRPAVLSYLLTFGICLATWLVFSGQFDPFHIGLGVLSSTVVAYLNARTLVPVDRLGTTLIQWARFIAYVPWLLWQIWQANLHLLRLVFHPRMMQLINPRIVGFKSRLDSQMGLFIMANSITLTPGTITVFASVLGHLTVHTIDDESVRGLPGEMEQRVARIFED